MHSARSSSSRRWGCRLTSRCSGPPTIKCLAAGVDTSSSLHCRRARVLNRRRAAAELGRYAPRLASSVAMLILAFCAAAAQPSLKSAELLHAFVVNNQVMGYLYGFKVPETGAKPIAAYSRLEIRNSTASKYEVLYRVERRATYFASGRIDVEISDDGSSGFYLEVQRPNYVVVQCCKLPTKDGRISVGDGLEIEWNAERGRFERIWRP
jgi:hypothetical protein